MYVYIREGGAASNRRCVRDDSDDDGDDDDGNGNDKDKDTARTGPERM